jgi:ubiquinone biosynthesis protein
LEEIVGVLHRYGLAEWLKEGGPDWLRAKLKGAAGEDLAALSREKRIRLALTELGTTFIKIGQMLSTRSDLVGPDLAKELSKLQADTPADPPETARGVVEAELGRPIGELFAAFEDRALASASIGQVHAATLADGRPVVVKVQHPGIEDRITEDLEILTSLAGLAERVSVEARLYQPRAAVAEFRRNLLAELDFTREARNLVLFGDNFQDDPTVHIPTPFRELTRRRVLTMEKLDGVSLAKAERLREEGVDTQELAVRGANLYLEMIFRDGVYHADPHPGNIFALTGGVLGLLDFGTVGRLDPNTREELEELMVAGNEQDVERVTDVALRMGSPPPDLDREALQADIGDFVDEFLGGSLEDLDVGGAVESFMAIVRRNRLLLPARLTLLGRVLVQLEGTSRLLERDFSLSALLKPYLSKMAARRFAPQRLLQGLQRAYRDWSRLIDIFPGEVTDILRRVRAGSFDVNLRLRHLDLTVNRLVYGMIVVAIVLGSSLVLALAVPPKVGGVSVIGAAGVVLAVVLGWKVLRAVTRSGGLVS